MNPEATSKEKIMQVCRRIASEKGLKALNMRAVAGECGIALGTLYNYFSDKEELLIAAITSVWQDIFSLTEQKENSPTLLFSEYVEKVFINVSERFRDYPDFFTAHSVAVTASGKDRAKNAMETCTDKIRDLLLAALRRDNLVSPQAFKDSFSEESFVDFILDSIILLLIQQKSSDTLIAIIKRIIYQEERYAGNI
ncbi:MAG: TetR/AcrR family transcriptional regulator [Ruminococcus sp.]